MLIDDGQEQARSSRRKKTIFKKVLVVCEGEKTEINYFTNIAAYTRQTIDVIPHSGIHNDPVGIVADAKEKLIELIDLAKKEVEKSKDISIDKDKPEGNPIDVDNGDEVWVVFDRDSNNMNQLLEAKKMADQERFQIAFSNPCFEIWCIFHYFRENELDLSSITESLPGESSQNAKTLLKTLCRGYARKKDLFDCLKDKYEIAVENSEKYIEKHESNNIEQYSIESNPSSSVHKLILSLNINI